MLASQADGLLYRTKAKWEDHDRMPDDKRPGSIKYRRYSTAELFSRLARAVAILAYCPGGVDVAGAHYEAR